MNPVQAYYNNPYFESLRLTEPFQEYLRKEEQKVRGAIRGGRVLDLGCGNGRSTAILADVSDEVVGIDFSERLLEQAKLGLSERDNVRLFYEDAKSMHFEDGSFDYVVMLWNTFGNLYSARDQVLRESRRVLKPNGALLISTFSENCLGPYLEFVEHNGLTVTHHDENYVFLREGLISERFNRQKLEAILRRVGLEPKTEKLSRIAYWCEARK